MYVRMFDLDSLTSRPNMTAALHSYERTRTVAVAPAPNSNEREKKWSEMIPDVDRTVYRIVQSDVIQQVRMSSCHP
jgi:hypothetical protein